MACESLFDTVAENELPVLEKEAVSATQHINFLFQYRYSIADDTLQTVHTTFVWLAKMDDVMQTCSELLSKYEPVDGGHNIVVWFLTLRCCMCIFWVVTAVCAPS